MSEQNISMGEMHQEIKNLKHRISTLEYIIEWLFENNESKLTLPTKNQIDQMRENVKGDLKKKHPNWGY
jgi:aryl-alcohol dehydrogenase-like predicted oxidoreductase